MKLHERESHADPLKAKANRILDDARAGLNITEEQITWALRILGDLE